MPIVYQSHLRKVCISGSFFVLTAELLKMAAGWKEGHQHIELLFAHSFFQNCTTQSILTIGLTCIFVAPRQAPPFWGQDSPARRCVCNHQGWRWRRRRRWWRSKETPCVMMVPKRSAPAPLLGLHPPLVSVVQPEHQCKICGYWLKLFQVIRTILHNVCIGPAYLRCVRRNVVSWSVSKPVQYLIWSKVESSKFRMCNGFAILHTHKEVDQLPGHLVLLLLQVFYLEVKLRKFLVNPVQSGPYHSGENCINIIPHYCCKLEMHRHYAVSFSLRSEPYTFVGNKHTVGKERRVC